jgi:hypothetical protein
MTPSLKRRSPQCIESGGWKMLSGRAAWPSAVPLQPMKRSTVS